MNRINFIEAQIVEYGKSPCKDLPLSQTGEIRLPNEAHVAEWKKYLKQDGNCDWIKLQQNIPQFNIPIREGISQTDLYVSVARKGKPFSEKEFGQQFSLREPNQFCCFIYQHPAGELPVLYTENRDDFEDLFRIAGFKCEPIFVNPSINALMISGFTNWQRVFNYQEKWLEKNRIGLIFPNWYKEMQRIEIEKPDLFKDRFIIVTQAPYGGLDVQKIGIVCSAKDWLEISFMIRLEHEFTHYALKRVFNVMRVHVWDEVVADFMGITKALNSFNPEIFLHCLGISIEGKILPKARLTHYISELSPKMVCSLCRLLVDVSFGLERFFKKQPANIDRLKLLFKLSRLSLIEMSKQ